MSSFIDPQKEAYNEHQRRLAEINKTGFYVVSCEGCGTHLIITEDEKKYHICYDCGWENKSSEVKNDTI